MNLRLVIYLIACSLFYTSIGYSQQPDKPAGEKVFTLADLQEIVFKYHPVIKQAALLTDAAKANVMQSLGYFDPNLKANFNQKVFGGYDYYNHWTSELKVPLWLAGADLKVGYDRNVGTYTNPETATNLQGLTGVGLSIPLGQGFIIDSRRSTLKQAKIMVQYAEAERVKQINSTWYDIAKQYWNWYYTYRQFVLNKEGLDLAQKRFNAVSTQTKLGDKASIDSVEAFVTVQERLIQLEKNQVELKNARLILSNNLWDGQGNPVELPEDAKPQNLDDKFIPVPKLVLDSLISRSSQSHPELLKLRTKDDQLAVEQLYRKELLKPKLNITGSLISNRNSLNGFVADKYDFNWNNHKFGFEFAFPLFLRAERGKLTEVKIKRKEIEYDLQQSAREISNNITTTYNDLQAYATQIIVQKQSINNQQLLLNGENQKFSLGESTLFLINSRETKLIEMRVKYENMVAGYNKALSELYYKAGTRQAL